jgi:hypothetical protein
LLIALSGSDVRHGFTAVPPHSLTGRITSSDGKPVAKAKVFLWDEEIIPGQWFKWHVRTIQTATDGTFRLSDLPPLEHALYYYKRKRGIVVVAPGYGLGVREWNKRQEPDRLEMQLGKAADMRGTVKDTKGRPLQGAKVMIRLIVPPLIIGQIGTFLPKEVSRLVAATQTNKEGAFVLHNMPADAKKVEVVVEKPRYGTTVKTVTTENTSPAPIDFVLAPAATIKGKVLYGEMRKPVPQTIVEWMAVTPSGLVAGMTRTDKQGGYIIPDVPAGKNYLWLDLPQNFPWVLEARQNFEVRTGESVTAPNLLLVRGGFVEGTVIERTSRKPVPGAAVIFTGPSHGYRLALTNAGGKYRIRLAPGENKGVYNNNLPEYPGDVNLKSVTVVAGQTATLNFEVMRKENLPTSANPAAAPRR